MNHRISRILFALTLLGLLHFAPTPAAAAPNRQDLPDIIATATAAEGFDTLLAALDAAGLTETLQGEGPFTVFAPTDEAFAALPEGTVDALLQDPTGALTDILLYHVVAGEVTAASAVNAIGGTLEMVNGHTTTLNVVGNRLLLNDAGFLRPQQKRPQQKRRQRQRLPQRVPTPPLQILLTPRLRPVSSPHSLRLSKQPVWSKRSRAKGRSRSSRRPMKPLPPYPKALSMPCLPIRRAR
jgi:hypothetical protein